MTPPSPKRPWWRKKRWPAALAFSLAFPVADPLSAGPCLYLGWRAWPSPNALGIYAPLEVAIEAAPAPVQGAADDYLGWWVDLAIEHRGPSL